MKKTRTKEVYTKVYSTDHFAKGLWSHLLRDFRGTFGSSFCKAEDQTFRDSIPEFRSIEWKRSYWVNKYEFKTRYQLENLFKRYRFQEDAYSDEELQQITNEKFAATQIRISKVKPRTYRSHLVIQEARKIIKDVLGTYDEDEHYNACRFGKRASVGNAYSQSYLDLKIGGPITGSLEHIGWFKRRLQQDSHLADAISTCVPFVHPRYVQCNHLSLVNVPKSWKTLRSIMPNTLIGGFYTYGLGKVIEERLRAYGLDLRHLQRKHRRMVKAFSESLSHATADLSAASDSFTASLINALLPRRWYHALRFGRVDQYCSGEDQNVSKMTSFMTMGVGFTFPLQTLCFYAILEAISRLTNVTGTISVFGDDLIYPSSMHPFVSQIFVDLNFILNEDKTFVKENFRESCGEDAYCGISVRPFNPEGSSSSLQAEGYLQYLYKQINGLMLRWDKDEIPITYHWLLREILRVSPIIHQVPPSFPETSGVRVERPRKEFYIPWGKVHANIHGTYNFPILGTKFRMRSVWWQAPYYWDQLRQMNNGPDEEAFRPKEIADSPTLKWVASKRLIRLRGGQRMPLLIACVVRKGLKPKLVNQTGSTFAWI